MPATPAVLENLSGAFARDASFANPAVWVSAHSGDPGGTGANEITSGSGAGGRQLATFSVGGVGSDPTNDSVDIAMPADAVVPWAGFWTAQTGGTFLGGYPLVSAPCVATGVAGGTNIVCPAHGRAVNDIVRLYPTPNAQSIVPSPFVPDTGYYVLTVVDLNTLVLSATLGGSAITVGTSGGFILNLDNTQTFGPGGGTLNFSPGNIIYRTVS